MVNITAGITITTLKDDEILITGDTPMDVDDQIAEYEYERVTETKLFDFSGVYTGERTDINGSSTETTNNTKYGAIVKKKRI